MASSNVRFFAYGRFADNIILGAQAIEKTFEVSFLSDPLSIKFLGKL